MTDPAREPLKTEAVQDVLDRVAPGCTLKAIRPLPGSYSNDTRLVEAHSPRDALRRFVFRRYVVFGAYDRGAKAKREFHVLELLHQAGLPGPRPLLLDQSGDLLGAPGIVTAYVPGRQVSRPRDPERWARSMGQTLARLHALPCDGDTRSLLLDGNAEVTWFLQPNGPPNFMQIHPDGLEIWRRVAERFSNLPPAPPSLVHVDYWSGNILWRRGQIVAVLDWEEAAWGDPGIDVAYCRLDLTLLGLGRVVPAFLAGYEAVAERAVTNLAFWELVAAARPLFQPEGWISHPPAAGRFRRFVAEARNRL